MIKIRTVGDAKIISSAIYTLHLLNKDRTGVPFKLYGVKTISNDVLKLSMDDVKDVDVLIGIGNAPKHSPNNR